MRRYYYSSQCWPIYVIHVPYVSVIVVPSDSLSLRYLYVTATSSLYLNWFYICSQVLIPCLCCYLIYLNWFYICSQAAYLSALHLTLPIPPRLSSAIISYHQLSSAIISYHHLSSAIICYHQLSSAIISCHLLSSAIISYHQLSSAIINHHQLSSAPLFHLTVITHWVHLYVYHLSHITVIVVPPFPSG